MRQLAPCVVTQVKRLHNLFTSCGGTAPFQKLVLVGLLFEGGTCGIPNIACLLLGEQDEKINVLTSKALLQVKRNVQFYGIILAKQGIAGRQLMVTIPISQKLKFRVFSSQVSLKTLQKSFMPSSLFAAGVRWNMPVSPISPHRVKRTYKSLLVS